MQPVSDRAWGARRLGFGVSGPHGTPLVSRNATDRMIQRAFELGVRLFDTAPSYGNGEAETRLGQALKRLPRLECIISTKVGIYSSGVARRDRDFSADRVRRSIAESLERLQVSRIDWLFLHGPAPDELTDGLFKALQEEQYAGRIGLLGVAGRGDELLASMKSGLFKLYMAPVHAGLDTDQIIRLSKLRNSGAELIGIESLAAALAGTAIPTGRGGLWRMAKKAAGRAPETEPIQQTPTEAITWALTEGQSHRVVTTTTSQNHLKQNVEAALAAESDA